MKYCIIATDTPDSLELRRSARAAHLTRLEELKQQGRLILAGPYFNQDTHNPAAGGIKGSLIIAEFDSLESAKEWAAADPYVIAGVYHNIEVNAFKQVY